MTSRSSFSATAGAAITPADDTGIGHCTGIYVGVSGDVNVKFTKGGAAVLFKGMAGGVVHPIRPWSVQSTSTTATDLVRVYEE